MKTLNWKRTDWKARNFIFSVGEELIGQLTFNSTWNFKAVYTDEQTQLKFVQNSFWNRDVLITKDGKAIAKIHSGIFGEQTLKLVTGVKYFISTSLWEQEVYWKTEKGETIIKYQQATMSSMENGLISLEESMTSEMEKLLISSGLFVRQMRRKRITRTLVIMLPILAAASKF
ncbi:MAG TPA: hypothetical protein VEZ55_14120 [Chitinophagaceae bacterium]|nr:hypothetical protein [Chitinophagaceae bacterium]